tara:strand:- start:326 stop:901 length:576 start_codon:yes stop_codon:yes gene_type:complete
MSLNFLSMGSGSPFIRFSVEDNEWTRSSVDGDLIPIDWKSPVVIDIEKIQQGWLKLAGGRDWQPWPDNNPTSIERPSMEHKQGFAVKFFSTKLFDDEPVRELSSSGAGMIEFIKALYKAAEPGFGEGKVPVVKMLPAIKVRIGKGPSKIPQFEIVAWVGRPAELDGDNAEETPAPAAATEAADDDSFDDEI